MLETRDKLWLWIALAILAVAGTASGLYLNSKVRHQAEMSVAKQASESLSGNIEQVQTELTQLELTLAAAQSEHEQLMLQSAKTDEAILQRLDSLESQTSNLVTEDQLRMGDLSVAKQASESLSGNIEQVQTELTQLELALAAAQSEHEQLMYQLGGQQTAILSLKDSTIIRVESIVFFETGSTLVKPTAEPALNIIGEWLEKYPNRNIRIDGHTDDRQIGQELSQQYPSNWELSVARADAVKHFILTTHPSVAHERVIAVGRGSNYPIATNATESGRQQNRRVEFFLTPRKDPNILK